MSLIKVIGQRILSGIKTVEADVKAFFTKAKPILVDVEAIAVDLLSGKPVPPTGCVPLDDFFKALQILVPYYKGDKTALIADIQEAVTFFENVAFLFGV